MEHELATTGKALRNGQISSALDTSGRDLQFLLRLVLGQVKNEVTGVNKVKIMALEEKFFIDNFQNNPAGAKITVPSSSSY